MLRYSYGHPGIPQLFVTHGIQMLVEGCLPAAQGLSNSQCRKKRTNHRSIHAFTSPQKAGGNQGATTAHPASQWFQHLRVEISEVGSTPKLANDFSNLAGPSNT